jgi:hypothetical protein
MRPPTSLHENRIGGPQNFRPPVQIDFCNSIGVKADMRDYHKSGAGDPQRRFVPGHYRIAKGSFEILGASRRLVYWRGGSTTGPLPDIGFIRQIFADLGCIRQVSDDDRVAF